MKFLNCPSCANNGLPFIKLLGPPRSNYTCKVCGANLKISKRSALEFWGIFIVVGVICSKLWDQFFVNVGENNGIQFINFIEVIFVYGPPFFLAFFFAKTANRTLMEVVQKPQAEDKHPQ